MILFSKFCQQQWSLIFLSRDAILVLYQIDIYWFSPRLRSYHIATRVWHPTLSIHWLTERAPFGVRYKKKINGVELFATILLTGHEFIFKTTKHVSKKISHSYTLSFIIYVGFLIFPFWFLQTSFRVRIISNLIIFFHLWFWTLFWDVIFCQKLS